eukprot:c4313_g1_i1.p1 GENE.c4313_g1_i1~~c4313_g1_i1.p1  ORF type:complete len:139 (+),score=18.24 c4313_g1_i1:132-548(+)
MRFCFTLRQSSGDETRTGVYVCPDELHEMSGSRGTANLIIKFGKSECTMSFTEVKKKTRRVYTAEDSGNFVPIVAFECRGVEPVKWEPSEDDTVNVTTSAGTVFRDVDLSSLEWCEYDEKADSTIAIYKLEHKFEAIR